MVYCKHADHTPNPLLISAGDCNTANCRGHGIHAAADIGILDKPNEDYHALLATHGDGLFAHCITTWGSEMT